jgi:HAD superfamily hydrolase (TIGR01490 family)
MADFHIFDMDGTLVDNDCDVSWKVFLVDIGIAPKGDDALAVKYYEDYRDGVLDLDEFLAFQLREFVGHTKREMAALCQRHFDEVVRPKCRPGAIKAAREVAASGKPSTILSSTNTMISEPVRAFFGIRETAGPTLELDASGRFTGHLAGPYTLGPQKVVCMRRMTERLGVTPENTAAYGDSAADIPLLSSVGHPFVVAPSAELRAEAEKRHWPILKW